MGFLCDLIIISLVDELKPLIFTVMAGILVLVLKYYFVCSGYSFSSSSSCCPLVALLQVYHTIVSACIFLPPYSTSTSQIICLICFLLIEVTSDVRVWEFFSSAPVNLPERLGSSGYTLTFSAGRVHQNNLWGIEKK